MNEEQKKKRSKKELEKRRGEQQKDRIRGYDKKRTTV